MKRTLKSVLSAAICAAMLLGTGTALAAESDRQMAVQVNGEIISLTDAYPQKKGETIYVPFRAVMEAMDIQVGFDNGVITAKTDHETLTLTPGSDQAIVEYSGGKRTVTMDAAVYIDPVNWRTYVPLSALEKTIFLDTGYDVEENTVIVADLSDMAKTVTEGMTFEYIDGIMGYDTKYMEGIWDVDVTVDGYMTSEECKIPVSGRISGTAADSKQFQIQINFAVDVQEYAAKTGEKKYPVTAELAEALATKGLDNELRADMNTGKCYLRANGALADKMGAPGAWYQMDTGDLAAQFGFDMQSMIDYISPLGYEEVFDILDLFSYKADFDHVEDYDLVKPVMERMFSDLCDASFHQEGSSYVLELGPQAETSIDLIRLTLTMDGDTATGYSIYHESSFVSSETGKQVQVVRDRSMTDNVQTIHTQVYQDGVQTRDVTRVLTYTPGTTAPVTAPEEGAQVLELSSLIGKAQ